MTECPACGAPTRPDLDVCPNCGAATPVEAPAAQAAPAGRKWWMALALLALAVVGGVYWWWRVSRPLPLVAFAPAQTQLYLELDVVQGRGLKAWQKQLGEWEKSAYLKEVQSQLPSTQHPVDLVKDVFPWLGSEMAVIVFPKPGTAGLWESIHHAKAERDLRACESNLKNVGTACEMWAFDHGGSYSDQLQDLVPSYLAQQPHCPGGGVYAYTVAANRRHYRVSCTGGVHGGMGLQGAGPSYTDTAGLDEGTRQAAGVPEAAWSAVACRVRDRAKADAFLRRVLGGASAGAQNGSPAALIQSQYQDVTLTSFSGSPSGEGAFAFTGGTLLYAAGADAVPILKACIDARQRRHPSLDTQPAYTTAVRRWSGPRYAFFFLSFEQAMQGIGLKDFGARGAPWGELLVSLRYFAGVVASDARGGRWEFFLAMDPNSAGVMAKAILSPGHRPAPFVSPSRFPATTGYYWAVDIKYCWDLVMAGLATDPSLKSKFDRELSDLSAKYQVNVQRDVLDRMTGEIAYGIDLSALISQGFTQGLNSGREWAQLHACETNLKSLGTALDRYEADHGSFPAGLPALVPSYLPALPSCPSGGTYGYAPRAGQYRIECRTDAHAPVGVGGDQPAFDSSHGLLPPRMSPPTSRTGPMKGIPLTLFVGVKDYPGAKALYDRLTASLPSDTAGGLTVRTTAMPASVSFNAPVALALTSDGLFVDLSEHHTGITAAMSLGPGKPDCLQTSKGYAAMVAPASAGLISLGYINFTSIIGYLQMAAATAGSQGAEVVTWLTRFDGLWSGIGVEPEGVKMFLYAPYAH